MTSPVRIVPLPDGVTTPAGDPVGWIALPVFDLLVDLIADKAPGPEVEFVTVEVVVDEIRALLADAQQVDGGHWLVPLAAALTDDGVAQIQLCATPTTDSGYVVVTHVPGVPPGT